MISFFGDFLTTLSSVIGFQIPPSDEPFLLDETVVFEFDDQVVPHTILMSAAVGPLLKDESEFYVRCLEANDQMRPTLSLYEDTLYLHQRVDPSISVENLKKELEDFKSALTIWKSRVS